MNIVCNIYFVNYLAMPADGVALGTVNSSQSREQNDVNKAQFLVGNLDALMKDVLVPNTEYKK